MNLKENLVSEVRERRPRRKLLSSVLIATWTIVCGATLYASAQDEASPQIAPADALAEARGIVAQLSASVESVRGQFQKAQKDGDPIKAVCLDDKLTQLEDASSAVASRLSSLEDAVSGNDAVAIAQNSSVMKALGQSAANLTASAKQCIGEEKSAVSVADSLNVVVDPNIVQANVVQSTSLSAGATSGAVQAAAPVVPPSDDMMRGPDDMSPTN